MKTIIVLDSGPLGLLMQRRGLPIAEACRTWIAARITSGAKFIVPEIADYEVRRELIRLGKSEAIARMDLFNAAAPNRYLPITTASIRRTAEFWADTRTRGLPTADSKSLDADVILAAQATTAFSPTDLIVATTNPIHLSRFLDADLWSNL